MIEIHAVKAVYDAPTFSHKARIALTEPSEYKCVVCPFRGNLEEGVSHVVEHQFRVPFVPWEDRLK